MEQILKNDEETFTQDIGLSLPNGLVFVTLNEKTNNGERNGKCLLDGSFMVDVILIMVVVIDADYNEETREGHVAGIVAKDILAEQEEYVVTAIVTEVEDYIPGQFYRRELQSVEAIICQIKLEDIEMIVVDGYADSGTEEHALGTYVYEKYNIPVIGIGKNKYDRCVLENLEVYRGESRKALYVTSKGLDNEQAKTFVKKMAGQYRLPYLVKFADNCARNWKC